MSADAPMLDVRHLSTGYGRVEVLRDVTFSVPRGTVVAVLGPNGVGKSTLLAALSGSLPAWKGEIALGGHRIEHLGTHQRARLGVTLVPEGRGVFPGLSVRDNLAVAARSGGRRNRGRVDEVLDVFPRLGERIEQLAGTMSGGEQQMLALARAFLADNRVLLLDEISMGLAPIVVEQLFAAVGRLAAAGITIVLVEQYLTYALTLADTCHLIAKGTVSFSGPASELEAGGAAGYLVS